jgi:hypothetical protein
MMRRYGLGPTAGDERLGLPVLLPEDGWYRAVEEELSVEDVADLRLLYAVLRTDRGARPYQDPEWRRQVQELRLKQRRRVTYLMAQMLDELADAVPFVQPGEAADGRPLVVGQANTVRAVNLVWAAVELDLERRSPVIGRVLLRAVSEPWTMQSVRVRNACANALVEIGTPQATEVLAEAATRAQAKALREQLLLCVARAARRSEQPPSRLAELQVAHHGLDEQGRHLMAVRGNRFEMRILPNGRVKTQYLDATGRDDAARRVALHEVLAIGRTYRQEVARIEALLAAERDWDPADWARIYLGNPITRAVASRLIWRQTYQDGRSVDRIPGWDRVDVVAYTSDGGLWSAAVRPAEDAPYRVSLWHPREAEPAMLATWREALGQYAIAQPFEQVKRDFTRAAPESDATELDQNAAARVAESAFVSAARDLGWHSRRTRQGPHSDAVRLVYRDFPDDRVSAAVPCPESGNTVVLGVGWFYRTEDRARTPLPLGAIAPRVYSEAVRDLAVLASGNSPVRDAISDDVEYEDDDADSDAEHEDRESGMPPADGSDSIE